MQCRALIVEDEDSYFRLIEIRLRAWKPDLHMERASSLAQAREILDRTEEDFDLLILDQQLPDGRGVDLLTHPKLAHTAILAVSSDTSADLPAQTVEAGARYFLHKRQLSEPLFLPLLDALIKRKHLEDRLLAVTLREQKMEAVQRLLSTLRHEINNPLGAVLGATFLMDARGSLNADQQRSLDLIEESGRRIHHVVEQLCSAANLEEVTKGREPVYQVPGDKPWKN